MPAERLSKRRVREILRYRFEDRRGHKPTDHRVGAAPSPMRETKAALAWPRGEDVGDAGSAVAAGRDQGRASAAYRARLAGGIRDAHIFAAVLSGSIRSCAQASWTDTLPAGKVIRDDYCSIDFGMPL